MGGAAAVNGGDAARVGEGDEVRGMPDYGAVAFGKVNVMLAFLARDVGEDVWEIGDLAEEGARDVGERVEVDVVDDVGCSCGEDGGAQDEEC